jgi:hypothetical protein
VHASCVAPYHRKTDTCVPFITVLRDAQEQRAARLEAERKLVEFQEQLKKVLSRQHDPVGGAFTTMQMTQAFQLPTINTGNAGDAQLPTARPGTRLAASEA